MSSAPVGVARDVSAHLHDLLRFRVRVRVGVRVRVTVTVRPKDVGAHLNELLSCVGSHSVYTIVGSSCWGHYIGTFITCLYV